MLRISRKLVFVMHLSKLKIFQSVSEREKLLQKFFIVFLQLSRQDSHGWIFEMSEVTTATNLFKNQLLEKIS